MCPAHPIGPGGDPQGDCGAKARRGAHKAATATARKLAGVIYHLLKYQEEFVLLDTQVCEAKAQRHRLARLEKEAKATGYSLVELQHAA